MISFYTTAFNLDDFDIDIEEALLNWLYYADEVIIATINKDYKKLKQKVESSKLFGIKKIKIVSKDIDIKNDIFWDGKLKNLSLQNCTNKVAFQVDLDERISGSKEDYMSMAEELSLHDFPCSIMIPTINLYGDLEHFTDIGHKWYIHTQKNAFRGTVNFAIKEDGCFDPEKSDTCELIDNQGALIPCIGKINFTKTGPKVIHLGTLDFKRRANLNKNFWREIWSERKTLSQKKQVDAIDVLTDSLSFEKTSQEHNLPTPLWPTL
tara:strand:- start:1788 stop:2582 length:795 start_codon:yes stop_codon:yes gene_type:complete